MGEEEVAQKLLMEAMKKAKNLKNPAAYEKKMEKKRLLKKEEEQRKELEANLDKDEQIGEKVIDKPWKLPLMMMIKRRARRTLRMVRSSQSRIKSPRSLGMGRKRKKKKKESTKK